jgi:hypothetical protein
LIGKIVIIAVVLIVGIAVAALVFLMPQQDGMTAVTVPNVKFVSFDVDRKDITMGETTNMIYNVQNFEERAIADARVTILIESPGYEQFLSIQNQTIVLTPLPAKDAATGEVRVPITATGSPAREAVYVVKGILIVEGVQTDVRELELKIHQQ